MSDPLAVSLQPERQPGESFDAYRERRRTGNRAVRLARQRGFMAYSHEENLTVDRITGRRSGVPARRAEPKVKGKHK